MKLMLDVGYKILLLRKKHGLKQINLANAMQVSPQAVSKWEHGANCPDISQLVKIAKLFNVSTDFLFGVTDAQNGVFEATVFCTGVTRFARRSISMASKNLANYVNGLLYQLTESVLKFDGIPIKYVGDGFLCFFFCADHADRAIKAAIYAKKVIFREDLVIAVHSGEIYLGIVGHPNYAMRDIVGESVNRAFLMLEWISNHCTSGIGATGTTVDLATKYYTIYMP